MSCVDYLLHNIIRWTNGCRLVRFCICLSFNHVISFQLNYIWAGLFYWVGMMLGSTSHLKLNFARIHPCGPTLKCYDWSRMLCGLNNSFVENNTKFLAPLLGMVLWNYVVSRVLNESIKCLLVFFNFDFVLVFI